MTRWILALTMVLHGAAAQLAAQSSEVVKIQHQRPEAIFKLIQPMFTSFTNASFDNDLKVITLGGPPEVLEMLVRNIAKLDVAPSTKSIALTVHLLLGSQEPDGKTPDELSGVLKQLHGVFPFKGYQLLDTNVQWSLAGKGGMTGGVIPGAADEQPATYEIRYISANIIGEGSARQISITQFDFNSRFTYRTSTAGFQTSGGALRSDVMLREGQKVVIGKSTLGPGRESLFVVLSAKVVD